MGDLLVRRPEQYWLRGDAALWTRLADDLGGLGLPESFASVREIVESAYERVVGVELPKRPSPDDMVPVDALSIGHGMSDGLVSPHFWRFTAIPIVIDRWAAARRRG